MFLHSPPAVHSCAARHVSVLVAAAGLLLSSAPDFHGALLLAALRLEHTSVDQATREGDGGEIVLAAKLLEADNAVRSNTVDESDDRGEHLDAQPLDEEGCTFSVEAHEAALGMHLANLEQMHVDNLAALEVLVEESHHGETGLSHHGKELALDDLDVGTVTLGHVLLLFLVLELGLGDFHLAVVPHDLLALVVHQFVKLSLELVQFIGHVLLFLVLLDLFDLLAGVHLGLDLGGLVFNGLLDDHVGENIARQRHSARALSALSHYQIQISI